MSYHAVELVIQAGMFRGDPEQELLGVIRSLLDEELRDHMLYTVYPPEMHGPEWHLRVKVHHQDDVNALCKQFPAMRHYQACIVEHCFQQVAAPEGIIVFESSGIDLHSICEFCVEHLSPRYRQMVKTLEMVEIEGGEWWTRVYTWKSGRQFYGQKVWCYDEGDYEVGCYPALQGSEHYGPFDTRAGAFDTATERWKEMEQRILEARKDNAAVV